MQELNATPAMQYEDRQTGLVIFGIFLIILGCCAILMFLLLLLSMMFSGHHARHPISLSLMLPGLLMYLFLAVTFIGLGIGSIKCRRWARALTLVFTLIWMYIGLEGVAIGAVMLPDTLASGTPVHGAISPDVQALVTFILLSFCFFMWVVVPALLFFFYRSRHVKATCEARDPVTRWTDLCPLPILGLSGILALCGASVPLVAIGAKGFASFFGRYVGGWEGVVMHLAYAVIFSYAAYLCYKLRKAGWWLALMGISLWMSSSVTTVMIAGILPMYEHMGVSPARFEHLKQVSALYARMYLSSVILFDVPLLGFIVFTKRYFDKHE